MFPSKPRKISVTYIRGPLDGLTEDLSRALAATDMLVGPNNEEPPEGWYTKADANGRRFWVEGAPKWWKSPSTWSDTE